MLIAFHSLFIPEPTYQSSLYLIDALFAPLRFGVPVFFTISFLLLERSLEKNTNSPVYPLLKKRFIRLLIPTLLWCTLAGGLRFLGKANSLDSLPTLFLQGKIFPGSYYLVAMLQLLPIFVYLNRKFGIFRKIFLILLAQLVVFALIYIAISGGFGKDIIVGLRNISRASITYWFVYMSLGVFFYHNWFKLVKISVNIPVAIKLVLLVSTSLIMMAEYNYLLTITGGTIIPFEYSMFSCILSALVMFICFSSVKEEQLPFPIRVAVKLLSKYSLGIYCINGIFSLIFLQIGTKLSFGVYFNLSEVLAIKLMGWIVLLILSLGMSVLLDKFRLGSCVS